MDAHLKGRNHVYSHIRTQAHSMHLGPKISGVEFAFLSAWWRGYILNHTLWRTGIKNPNLDARYVRTPEVHRLRSF